MLTSCVAPELSTRELRVVLGAADPRGHMIWTFCFAIQLYTLTARTETSD